jgi:hypothetical protein
MASSSLHGKRHCGFFVLAPILSAGCVGSTLAQCLRDMVNAYILERGAALRERGAAFRGFVNAGKTWE